VKEALPMALELKKKKKTENVGVDQDTHEFWH
jgi:hypothetical protein